MCVDNRVQETIRDVCCPTCRSQKCAYISTNKIPSLYDSEKVQYLLPRFEYSF